MDGRRLRDGGVVAGDVGIMFGRTSRRVDCKGVRLEGYGRWISPCSKEHGLVEAKVHGAYDDPIYLPLRARRSTDSLKHRECLRMGQAADRLSALESERPC